LSELEIWKTIEDFPGYEVSTLGRVRNKESRRLLKGALHHSGYWQYCLRKEGNTKTIFIHRLVAKAFIPNPHYKPQVNHIDGNKLNNKVSNLEWVTNQENHDHKMAMGLNVSPGGERHGMAKLTEPEVEDIYRLSVCKTMKQKDIAEKYGVSIHTVKAIRYKQKWKNLTDKLDKEWAV